MNVHRHLNVHLPPAARHQELRRLNRAHRRQKILQEEDVSVHIPNQVKTTHRLHATKNAIEQWRAELVTSHMRFVSHAKPERGFRDTGVIPKENDIARWIERLPAGDRVSLDEPHMTIKGSWNGKNREHSYPPLRCAEPAYSEGSAGHGSAKIRSIGRAHSKWAPVNFAQS